MIFPLSQLFLHIPALQLKSPSTQQYLLQLLLHIPALQLKSSSTQQHLLQLILPIKALQLKSSSTQQLHQLLHWCLRPASLAVSTEGLAVLLIIPEVASAHQTTVGLGASMKKVSLCICMAYFECCLMLI